MDIFISYSRVDKVKVFSIVNNIKQNTGLDFWIDLDGIESGDAFEHKIINAINNCEVVLFMMSKKSVSPYIDEVTGKPDYERQTWTEKEIKYAISKKKRVVLISIDGTTATECDWLAFNCSGLDMIDYRNADQQQKLVDNLMHWVKGEDANGNRIIYQEEKPDNHILLCILSSICCCAPIGIYSIVLSGKVDYLYRKGDFTGSREMSKKAKKWAIISLCIGYLILSIFIGIYLAALSTE